MGFNDPEDRGDINNFKDLKKHKHLFSLFFTLIYVILWERIHEITYYYKNKGKDDIHCGLISLWSLMWKCMDSSDQATSYY